jgi:hypothetical protein
MLGAIGLRWALLFSVQSMLTRAIPIDWSWSGLPRLQSVLDHGFVRAVRRLDMATVRHDQGVLIVLAHVAFALLGAVIWAGIDRRRRHEAVIREVFFVGTRYALFVMAVGYGLVQKSSANFAIGPMEIARPFGEFSDFTFIWLGYSVAFNIFAGLAELSGGILLLFRRTATLAALLMVGALSNVYLVTLDAWGPGGAMTAGVYIMMAASLAAFGLRRPFAAFVLGRSTVPEHSPQPVRIWARPRLRHWKPAAKALLILLLARPPLTRMVAQWGPAHYESPLASVYDVVRFATNRVQPVGPAAAGQWRQVAVDDYFQMVSIRSVDDSHADFDVAPRYRHRDFGTMAALTAKPNGTFTLTRQAESAPEFPATMRATWTRIDSAHLDLFVEAGSDTLEVRLERRPWSRYPIVNPRWPDPWTPREAGQSGLRAARADSR